MENTLKRSDAFSSNMEPMSYPQWYNNKMQETMRTVENLFNTSNNHNELFWEDVVQTVSNTAIHNELAYFNSSLAIFREALEHLNREMTYLPVADGQYIVYRTARQMQLLFAQTVVNNYRHQ